MNKLLKGLDLKSPNPSQLKVGSVPGGNYLQIEEDGTLVSKGEGTVWDEVSQPLFAARLDTSSGRIDYNFDELTVDFAANARYPQEPVSSVIQAPHSWKIGGGVRPHLHWVQNQNAVPNILVTYRIYNNGDEVPSAWVFKALTSDESVFTYPGSGSIMQITEFDLATTLFEDSTISFTFDCKIYRDSSNASGLFSGADAYTGIWSAKYYDIHFEKDMNGSREEFIK